MRNSREGTSAPLVSWVSGEVWWLNPIWTAALMAVIVTGAAYLLPDSVYRIAWRTPKHFGDRALGLCAAFVAVFAAGCYVGNLRTRKAEAAGRDAWIDLLPWPALERVFRWSFWLAVAGYLFWARAAMARGATVGMVLAILAGDEGAADALKNDYMATIGGVTTLTQLGLVAVVLGAVIGVARGWRGVRWRLAVVFFLALVRAIANSERLALIELAVPLALILIRLLVLDSPVMMERGGWLVRLAPAIGSAGLLGLFATSEYFRSWSSFYSGGDMGFWTFVVMRLSGYYVTAVNNGALLIEQVPVIGLPFFTLNFLIRAPGAGAFWRDLYPNMPQLSEPGFPVESVLSVGANYEFNNPDGYLVPALDFGVVGGLVFWLLAGLMCGVVYRSFCRKLPLGLFVYPLLFVGVIEMPRVLYWGQGRVAPPLILMGLLAYYCVRWRSGLDSDR